ncbi:MAG: YoaK family protein [Myxococcota bacterium]
MYRLEREEFTRKPYIFLWGLLGFQAGFINAFGFLSCGRYVSHVTGFGTQIGLSLAGTNFLFALELLAFPGSFILGAFTSGVFTIARIEQGQRPHFEYLIAAMPIILILLVFFGSNGLFGPFGEELVTLRDFILLFALSFLCGLQNACFSIMTRGQIKTTHLTGISTDIGSDLARIYLGNLHRKELEISQGANLSRILIFIGFTSGSILSVLVCEQLNYRGLLVPFFTSIIVLLAVGLVSRTLDELERLRALEKR